MNVPKPTDSMRVVLRQCEARAHDAPLCIVFLFKIEGVILALNTRKYESFHKLERAFGCRNHSLFVNQLILSVGVAARPFNEKISWVCNVPCELQYVNNTISLGIAGEYVVTSSFDNTHGFLRVWHCIWCIKTSRGPQCDCVDAQNVFIYFSTWVPLNFSLRYNSPFWLFSALTSSLRTARQQYTAHRVVERARFAPCQVACSSELHHPLKCECVRRAAHDSDRLSVCQQVGEVCTS